MNGNPLSDGRSPASRGAQVLDEKPLRTFLMDAYWATEQCGTLGGLLLVRVERDGRPVPPKEMTHACQMLAQLARQVDAVGALDEFTVALVLKTLQRRNDTHLMMERVTDFMERSPFAWKVSIGMSVFPLCGPTPEDAWHMARSDLDGARSHDAWEHFVPIETLRTVAGSSG